MGSRRWQLEVCDYVYLNNNFLIMAFYKDMIIYKKAFELAMDIFEISKRFPKKKHIASLIK